MLSLFTKSFTKEDLLEALKRDSFSESRANKIAKSVDIFEKDKDYKTYLHIVAPLKRIEAVKWLIAQGLDVNAQDLEGNTPLILAAQCDSSRTVETLLDAGSDADIKNKLGRTALQESVLSKKYTSFEIIRNHTKDLTNIDFYGHNLIFHVVTSGHFKLLNMLIMEKKVPIKIKENNILFFEDTYKDPQILMSLLKSGISIDDIDEDGKNILFYMVRYGSRNIEPFKYALKMGIDIDRVDDYGDSILLTLVKAIIDFDETQEDAEEFKNELLDMVVYLIEKGVDTTVINNQDQNILTLVVENNEIKLLKILLQYGVDPDMLNRARLTTLTVAALSGSKYEEEMGILIDFGASPNVKDDHGRTVIEKLMDAYLFFKYHKKIDASIKKAIDEEENYLEILKKVLSKAETNLLQLNSHKEPYIFEAAKYGALDLLKLLAENGADFNQKSEEDINVIYKYIAQNRGIIKKDDIKLYYLGLKTIISLGADVNCRDSFGGITLHKAILENDEVTIKALINAGADLNAVDNRGRNMVHNCVWKNRRKIFIQLISYNKKLINSPDKFGVLPINYAAFLGYTDLVVALIDHEAHLNNTHKKSNYILNFLRRFHKNLDDLITPTTAPSEQAKLSQLIQNMKKEFQVTEQRY